jgi:hypothetical protein
MTDMEDVGPMGNGRKPRSHESESSPLYFGEMATSNAPQLVTLQLGIFQGGMSKDIKDFQDPRTVEKSVAAKMC